MEAPTVDGIRRFTAADGDQVPECLGSFLSAREYVRPRSELGDDNDNEDSGNLSDSLTGESTPVVPAQPSSKPTKRLRFFIPDPDGHDSVVEPEKYVDQFDKIAIPRRSVDEKRQLIAKYGSDPTAYGASSKGIVCVPSSAGWGLLCRAENPVGVAALFKLFRAWRRGYGQNRAGSFAPQVLLPTYTPLRNLGAYFFTMGSGERYYWEKLCSHLRDITNGIDDLSDEETARLTRRCCRSVLFQPRILDPERIGLNTVLMMNSRPLSDDERSQLLIGVADHPIIDAASRVYNDGRPVLFLPFPNAYSGMPEMDLDVLEHTIKEELPELAGLPAMLPTTAQDAEFATTTVFRTVLRWNHDTVSISVAGQLPRAFVARSLGETFKVYQLFDDAMIFEQARNRLRLFEVTHRDRSEVLELLIADKHLRPSQRERFLKQYEAAFSDEACEKRVDEFRSTFERSALIDFCGQYKEAEQCKLFAHYVNDDDAIIATNYFVEYVNKLLEAGCARIYINRWFHPVINKIESRDGQMHSVDSDLASFLMSIFGQESPTIDAVPWHAYRRLVAGANAINYDYAEATRRKHETIEKLNIPWGQEDETVVARRAEVEAMSEAMANLFSQ